MTFPRRAFLVPWQQLMWLDDVLDMEAQADARVEGNFARLESGMLDVEEVAEALVKGDFPRCVMWC